MTSAMSEIQVDRRIFLSAGATVIGTLMLAPASATAAVFDGGRLARPVFVVSAGCPDAKDLAIRAHHAGTQLGVLPECLDQAWVEFGQDALHAGQIAVVRSRAAVPFTWMQYARGHARFVEWTGSPEGGVDFTTLLSASSVSSIGQRQSDRWVDWAMIPRTHRRNET